MEERREEERRAIEIRFTPEGRLEARRTDGGPLTEADCEEARRLALPDAPLQSFARWGMIVHVWSVLLDDLIYFVSGREQVQALLDQGVRRGAIYTASELAALLRVGGLTGDQVKKVHEAKGFFNGGLVPSVGREDERPGKGIKV